MKQIAIAIDQLLNTLPNLLRVFYPGIEQGMADETISARAWRRSRDSKYWAKFMLITDKLFFWQSGHCYQSYLAEMERKQLPPEYSNEGK